MLKIKVKSTLPDLENKLLSFQMDLRSVPAFLQAIAIPKIKEYISGMPDGLQYMIKVQEEKEVVWDNETDEQAYQSFARITVSEGFPEEEKGRLESFLSKLKDDLEGEVVMHILGGGR